MTFRFERRRFLQDITSAAGACIAVSRICGEAEAAETGEWGDLEGRLVYDGTAPPRKPLTVDKDVECCGKFDIRDESLMVGQDGGLQNVYVYVRTDVPKIHPDLETSVGPRVTLDNRNCIFIPHCMSIWLSKQEFFSINSDPVPQNIAFSPFNDAAANFVLEVKGSASWKFKTGQRVPVPIACNYHPWERGYILPLAHPYVAITGTDGAFRIPKLPVGELEFQMWQERIGYVNTADWPRGRRKISIKPGRNDLGTLRLPAPLFDQPVAGSR
jgi:hypothetical protein